MVASLILYFMVPIYFWLRINFIIECIALWLSGVTFGQLWYFTELGVHSPNFYDVQCDRKSFFIVIWIRILLQKPAKNLYFPYCCRFLFMPRAPVFKGNCKNHTYTWNCTARSAHTEQVENIHVVHFVASAWKVLKRNCACLPLKSAYLYASKLKNENSHMWRENDGLRRCLCIAGTCL